MNEGVKIAVIGLGYVGLPLAVGFAGKYKVVGFDINEGRVSALQKGLDHTREVDKGSLIKVLDTGPNHGLEVAHDPERLRGCDFFIITVPTPVDRHNHPDMRPLLSASETVGKYLKLGCTVIYESTVYPGATEEQCVPLLERSSGLEYNQDFFVGYSPERINPGDHQHRLANILKVTSGSTPEAADRIDQLYKSIITAGTFKASSIKVAEAAKVIENSQRDINIAFVNELAKIFNLLDIDTSEVLQAAGTKWNFLPFTPGLVGGHCIGVDPFYLAQKAQEVGYHPEIILAGRKLNDSMGKYIAEQVVKLLIQKEIQIKGAKVLVLGITFKENCPDIRNTRVIDIVNGLEGYALDVEVYDPWANTEEVESEFGFHLIKKPEQVYEAIILAVQHQEFTDLPYDSLKSARGIIYDVKSFLPPHVADARL